MRAMVLEEIKHPLVLKEVPVPEPRPGEILLEVESCGVCRTDLHIVDGELPHPQLPLIPGHQVVGRVVKLGEGVTRFKLGDRAGIPWLAGTCQQCAFCSSGKENLCDQALFTGYSRNGGFAEYCTAHEEYALHLPSKDSALQLAPLLCAGLIGYRAFRLAQPAQTIGFYGFGSSAHLLVQIANHLGREVFVFTRPGDEKTQRFARSLNATWAGGSDQMPPQLLDAALIFAPVGALFPQALKAVKKGGKVVSAGIHMSDLPSFPYELLWGERSISSVANLTRQDGIEFMQLIENCALRVSVTAYPLDQANEALAAIRNGTIEGSAVLELSLAF